MLTCSVNKIIAKTTPNRDEVEKIITDLTAPTSFNPIIKRNKELANPPRLRNNKLGKSWILNVNDILSSIMIDNEIIPPINDFNCKSVQMGVFLFKITFVIVLSKAQNRVERIMRIFPIKHSSLKTIC